ncbi:restriction endonuclease subunit S [Helicobacter pylori]|uniref:Restriction endonuclease subunit S n=1 Tax=Helicobacter pylori TaxID=210 RepID=A0AAE7DUY1_HELPX|nr:restriction endonuclease subunit S [Helicobacter pylori]QJW29228.1 restriction endonuclease subunit S [Helicobacter pylori A45]QJW40521.1 restriction endonuclease subunit S [Helicobacter pylori]QJW41980.1 restriction endonuclease subunit S [Helicobacter pylori]QJW43435.1 restriction endonuclease subunit S [Helicobacter pylori]
MSDNVKLSEVCEILNSNVDKKTKENEQKVKLCNFIDVYNNWAITKYTSKKFMTATATQNEINKFSLKKGYVAITKDSETKDDIGISTYIADNFDNVLLGYHCTLLKPNQKVLNGKFLNAYLSSFYGRKYFSNCASGSGQRYTLTIDVINDLTIPLINIETQQKIARTLSILDQKIENNHKINELLHKILELLYEQYFVRFDFLDENNKPYQTSGGKMKFSKELNRLIPNDFEVKTLGELVDIFSGYSFQSNTYSNNKNDYILITNKNVQHSLVDLSITTNLLFLPKKLPKYCLLEPTNILITLTGHIGRCALVFSKNCILNQRVGVVLPKEKELNPFYYSLIRNPLFSAILQRKAIGSSQQNLSPIDTLKIQIPFNHKIIKQYSKTCENIIKLLVSNMQSTQTLTALRDFLLPLLLKQQVKPK